MQNDSIKIQRSVIMKLQNKIMPLVLILALIAGVAFAGDGDRIGTTGGTQVQIPVGGRTLAMNGSDIAFAEGVDALYWNPAGLGRMDGRFNGLFSSAKNIADISNNYFALAFNMGSNGALAVSIKATNFGEIPITTVDDMDGESGATYSPTFSVIGATYGRQLIDRVTVGFTTKLIYESVPRASATSIAFDFGIQYDNLMDVKGLGLGLAIRNIGQDMQYNGTGLLTSAIEEGESYDYYYYRTSSEDQLPASLEMGLTYMAGKSLLLSAVYQNNNTERDYLRVGGEMSFSDVAFVRAGYAFQLKDVQNPEAGESVYGLTFGGGVKFKISDTNIIVDYVFRPAQNLGNENLICLGVGL